LQIGVPKQVVPYHIRHLAFLNNWSLCSASLFVLAISAYLSLLPSTSGWLAAWLTGRLLLAAGCCCLLLPLAGCCCCWLVGWLAGWLAGCCWLLMGAGCCCWLLLLAGWLDGWPAGRLEDAKG
jgi:hypothetical protein